MAPKVSICIPAYNSAAYIRDSIESVLAQNFTDYEFIVCDDGSTDATPDLCASYRSRGLKYIRFTERGGQAGNWNRCLERARGQYVVLLHDDDLLEPGYLGRAAAILDDHPEAGLVHCTVQHIDDAGQPLKLQRLFAEDRVITGEAFWRRLIVEGCLINPAGVMVRRALYERVGVFTREVVWGIDWHMWLRMTLEASIAYLAEPLARYRQRTQSGTAAVALEARNGAEELRIVEDMFRRVGISRPELLTLRREARRQVAHRAWCLAETMCRQGFNGAARAGVRTAVRIHPAMLAQRRVWGLWAATYLGYDWFRRVHMWLSASDDTRNPARAATTDTKKREC